MSVSPIETIKSDVDAQTIYAFAHCETWLEDFAKSHQLSAHELTSRVANLLLAQTSREVLGTEHTMSTLRRQTTKRNKTTRKVAMAKRPYRKTQIGRYAKYKRSKIGYWDKMSPEERVKEMHRRMKKWSPEAIARWKK
jgi:hypothetical protein